MPETSPLREPTIDDMTIRKLTQAIWQSDSYSVGTFGVRFGRSPDRFCVGDIRGERSDCVTDIGSQYTISTASHRAE